MDNKSYIIKDTTIYIQKDSVLHWWHYGIVHDTVIDTINSVIIDSLRIQKGRVSVAIDRYSQGLKIKADCMPDTIRVPQYIEVLKFAQLEKEEKGFFQRISGYITTGFLISIALMASFSIARYAFKRIF